MLPIRTAREAQKWKVVAGTDTRPIEIDPTKNMSVSMDWNKVPYLGPRPATTPERWWHKHAWHWYLKLTFRLRYDGRNAPRLVWAIWRATESPFGIPLCRWLDERRMRQLLDENVKKVAQKIDDDGLARWYTESYTEEERNRGDVVR